jgi:hypothetical protein
MANAVNSNLKVFLEYDFAHRFDHPNKLAVAEDKTKNIFYLIILDKNDQKAIAEKFATLALPEIVKFVSKRQIVWLQECKENKLQYQFAWLSQLVNEYNEKQNHLDKITYENPSEWQIRFKVDLKDAFNETYQKKIVSKEITLYSTYDRLTKHKDIIDKIQQVFKEKVELQLHCAKKKCDKIHTVSIAVKDLSLAFSWDEPLELNSCELYKPLSEEATGNECIDITLQGNDRFLEEELNKIHEKKRGCM